MALVAFDGMEKFAAEGCQLVVRGGVCQHHLLFWLRFLRFLH